MKTQVLIAGAGPVGLTMAAELARFGVPVRIVDKAAQRTDKSKALVIWSRTLELIDRMGCGATFVDAGLKVYAASIHAGGTEIAHIALDKVQSPHNYALMIPQSETERLMEQHLNRYGVQVERNVEVMQFTEGESSVTTTLRHADGSEEQVASSWLAGCDGAHSVVRHQLGLEFHGDTLNSNWVLADVHLSGAAIAPEVQVMWHARGILAIFPINGDRYRVIADVGAGAMPGATGLGQTSPTLEDVQHLLDERGPGGLLASQPVWLAGFRINERKVKDYRVGRIFLAGDAAHIHSPAGGQGMNTGMQDAFNLAWKLALVEHGSCAAEPLLQSYSAERSAVGEQILAATGRLTGIGILQGEFKQALRNHMASLLFGFRPVRDLVANTLTEISIGYPDSPLNGTREDEVGHPVPGERAPIRASEVMVGGSTPPKFVVCGEGGAEFERLAERFSTLLEPKTHEPYESGGLWLVRPDGYVALATRDGNWAEIERYLGGLANASS